MSLQTNVLIDGRWVTQSVDPYRVRSQNMEVRGKDPPLPSLNLSKSPSLGLLTHTLVRSPVVKWIIPARIRHQDKNDVLFISADSVIIKKARGDSTLKEVAVKTDFDSTIRSARILGDKRQLTKNKSKYLYAIDGDHWQDEPETAVTTDGDNYFTDEEDIADDEALHRRELPPHILVLALDSNKIVFMCAVSGPSENVQLVCGIKELPAAISPLEQLGEHIAVDPKSRAMAVAAYEGRMFIYALKSLDVMRAELERKTQLEPIKQEKLILVDGTILKMEFLHPLEDDDRTVILLLIVSKNSRTKMLWYEWSTEEDFRSQLKPTANLLPPEEQVPLLLIPLKMYTAFILVCEHRITLYKDILTGSLHRIHHRLATVQDPQEPGSSKALPTWVQWARPTRSKHATVQDCVYLCREDGVVQYVVIDDRIDQMIDSTHQAGKLGINIDTSFATLDLGPNTDDLLVTGGAMSEGGLWSFAPREDAKHRAVVPNWSPLNDITAVNITAIKTNRTRLGTGAGKEARGQHRLYTCSGRGKHGAVSELHYGVHTANRYATLDLKAQLDMDVLGIWALHGFYGDAEGQGTVEERSKDVTYVVFSHPLRTSLLRMGLERDPKLGLTCDPGPVHEDVGIDLSCRTIVIGSTRDGITIQITETSLQATRLPMNFKIKEEGDEERNLEQKELENTARQTRYVFSFAGPRALTACIHSTKEDTFILLAMQQDENYYLQFGTFTAPAGYIPSERRIKLRTQPSYLTVLQTENLLLALVGTPECKLEVYLTDGKGASVGNPCSYDFTAPYGICDSIAIINVAGIQSGSTILCGLRNGKVQTLNLMRTQASYQISLREELIMGNTSVTVITDTKRKSRAIIYCENALYTLEYTRSRPNEAATVQRVWITDQAVSALQHGNLSEITQAVNSWLPEGNSGFGEGLFFCIDGNTLHTVSLGSGLKSQTIPQMIPQRLKVYGSPTRLIYSNQLQKLIVLQNKTTILRNRYINGAHNVPGKRSLRPQILFLDPANQTSTESDPDLTDIDDGKNPEHNHTLMESECKPGEKFLGITEWFPKVNGNEYHMLVINTVMSRAKKPTGRLLILAIQGGRSEQPKLAVKKRIELEGPVYSVATYPEKSLVYCCGNYLYLQSLGATDSSGVKWQSPTKLEMRSPGWHITVKAPYIYVSSTRESLSVYRYEAGQLIYQFGDQSARNGVHHINIPSQSLVLASDMSNTVVGLWQPPTRRIDNAMPTVFEAVFSTTITRMTTLTRPTWARSTYNAAAGTDPLQASVLGDEVVLGSSADGTLIQFDVISTGWRLLRLIQNMAQRSPVVCPFMGLQAFKHPVEPPTAKPHHLHIDGDILQRVVERGGAELLKEMLDVEPDAESHTDFESKEARWERCRELAGEVVDVGDREWLGRVIEWVRYQLRSAL